MASKLKVNRGTTFTIGVTYHENGAITDITGDTVRFTVKSTEYDSDFIDSDALLMKTVTSHINPTQGVSAITLIPTDTQQITPGKYFYDVKIKLVDGRVYKLDEGQFLLDGSPTNRLS